jgi:hypothetical protein
MPGFFFHLLPPKLSGLELL